MTELKGKPVADKICEDVKQKVEELKAQGKTACLATVRVGKKPEDIYYEQAAIKRMKSVGIETKKLVFDDRISEDELIEEIKKLNDDEAVSGILLFMPLPKHIDGDKVRNTIATLKDVDGLTDENALKIYKNDRTGFAPCTPSAVMNLLRFYGIDIQGKNAVIIGRSMVVGKPLSMLMLRDNATVTICHTKTKDIASVCRNADILVASAGSAKIVKADFVKKNAVVIDVGINEDENGNMCGDVDFDDVRDVAKAVTPVPGGIGSITTSILAKHVVRNL